MQCFCGNVASEIVIASRAGDSTGIAIGRCLGHGSQTTAETIWVAFPAREPNVRVLKAPAMLCRCGHGAVEHVFNGLLSSRCGVCQTCTHYE